MYISWLPFIRIREKEISKNNSKLTICFLVVIIAFLLIIYFLNFGTILTTILELILIPFAAAILIVSYFIDENLFVRMYHNFLKHIHKNP